MRALALCLLCCCVGEVGTGDAGAGGGSSGGGSAGGGSAGGTAGGSAGGSPGGGTAGGTAGGSAGGGTAGGSAGGSGGGVDAGVDAGASCTASFCEDFERYDAGRAPSAPWSTNVNGGTVTVDTSRAHAGAKSLHVTTDGAAAYRQAYAAVRAPFFPVNAFYGRAWFYVAAVPAMTTHWTNISGEGPVADAGTNVRAYVRYGGQVMKHIMANYDTSGVATDCWQHSTVAMPAGTWNCYEWHFDQPTNKMELWLDGTQLTEVTVNGVGMGCINNGLGGKWLLPQFDTLRLGWEHYQTSIPIDMWIDDVALSPMRIGCN